MRSDDIYVDGSWLKSTSQVRLESRSPSTEATLASVPDASHDDVDRAVAAARRALDEGPWGSTTPADRAVAMCALLRELEARRDRLTEVLLAETGTPRMLIGPAQVDNGLDVLRYYADLVEDYPFEQVREGLRHSAIVRQEPVGVVGAIVPWNAPFFLAMMKVAPALAAGCTVVLKAAPETPHNAYLIAEAAHACDLPAGVLNVLAAGPSGSERLVVHPEVDKIAFTGSTAVGERIAGLAGPLLKRLTLELGGKSAAVVLDDADLDATARGLVGATMTMSGQMCIAQSRVLVSAARIEEFLDRFTAILSMLPVGDPSDAGTFVGPLASERQRARVLTHVANALEDGARLVVGGGVPPGLERGWYVQPTVFRDVRPDSRLAQEEVFGPVVAVMSYLDEDDAVRIANDSRFGLHGTVWTRDVEHGLAVARRIRTGSFGVNGMTLDPALPFGGVKRSGLGRECGPEGLEAYLNSKTMFVPPGTVPSLAVG